jgi:DNA-binding response OmpR family regulator
VSTIEEYRRGCNEEGQGPRLHRNSHSLAVEQLNADSESTATVLVVDDEDAVRQSTAAILRTEGFHVLEAADGAAAMWTLASQSVDVLLLDLRLARVDGTAVMDALDASSTVVVFSGFESFEESEIRKGFGPLIFECLLKPVAPPRLIEVVGAAARDARGKGHQINVRPITPPMALRLAMAGLARLTPQIDHGEQDRIHDARTLSPRRSSCASAEQ